MGMTPDDYFDAFVKGNQCDFHGNRGSVRAAFNAAIAASHMADHYLGYNKEHSPDSRFPDTKSLLEYATHATDGAFRYIREIANAYKHLYVDGDASVESAGCVVSISIPAPGGEVLEITGGEEHEDAGRVYINLGDGIVKEFQPLLDSVVTFWEGLLSGGEPLSG